MSGRPGRSRRVRNVGGDREDRVEVVEEDDDYEDIDNPTDQGSQEATGGQAIIIERSVFRAAAVCLTALCVLVALRTTDRVINYHSAIKELQTINTVTLERDQWKTSYDNMTLQRDQWNNKYNDLLKITAIKELQTNNTLILERDQWKTSYDIVVLERDQWKNKYNHLCETAAKLCPSGWKGFGCSCYYKSTEMKTWEEHRELCLKTGADLVIINNEEEQEFIRGLNDKSHSWIGLKRTAGKWTWVDGTLLTTSQYWGRGKPENREDWNCASYWHHYGGWGNGYCSPGGGRAYGICEKKYL